MNNEPQPIGYTYDCPCGRKPTRLFDEKFLANRAAANHRHRNHGSVKCRAFRQTIKSVFEDPATVA